MKTIQQKMKSVKNIGKITKAMEMISVSKMKKSIRKRSRSVVFASRSISLLETLRKNRELSHPYLDGREGGTKALLVIVAANKGLCGGYNMNVSKQVNNFKKANPELEIDTIVVGRQAQKIALRNNLNILASFTEMSEYYSASEVRSLLHSIFEVYNADDQYEKVAVAYTHFFSSLSYEATIAPLVPLDIDEVEKLLDVKQDEQKSNTLYTFEPSEQEVLDQVVPSVMLTMLYQMLLESLASEHSSRVTAMKNASDNAEEMLDDLKMTYNQARQAGITQEIAEIVGGSSAMSS
jgi:F-type H+-transporting ATPase subunit gamma